MPKIITKIGVDAPLDLAFDLSRSIDFHMYTQSHNEEQAIGGVMTGLIELGEMVTWRARHFGIYQHLTAQLTEYNRPYHFRDTMVSGAFKRFDHDHKFESNGTKTIITDIFDYEPPFSLIGKLFDYFILNKYMTNFFIRKNALIKTVLESDLWKQFLDT